MARSTQKQPPADTPEPDAPAEAAPEEAPPNGVLVVKVIDENGNIATDTQPIGNVQPTEVQTLLELGVSSWRRKIGLV